MERTKEILMTAFGILLVVLLAGGFVGGCSFILPKYGVWTKTLEGEAELKKAEWNRQIVIKEAEAKFQASTKLAEAEVERAKGVAKANEIIGNSLKGNEDYLRYLYISGLTEGNQNKEIIYIPTEAGLPILEAGKRK